MKKEEVEAAIKSYQEVLELMNKPEDELSVHELIYLKYIQLENTTKAAKAVREIGKKRPNGNTVQPQYVSEVLSTNSINVPQGVMNIGQSIFKKNQSFSRRINT